MKTKDKMSLAFTGVLVLCAFVITGLVIRQEFFLPEPKPEISQVKNWRELELKGQRVGPAEAPVQIVEFFDYQCPYCKRVQSVVQSVIDKYPQKIAVHFEHYPLSGHRYATEAAVAAECAGRQGQFKRFHDLLFANQQKLRKEPYSRLGLDVGIKDITLFNKCWQNEQTKQIVQSGRDLAKSIGINAVPAFIINGTLMTGALSEQRLDKLVRHELNAGL